jgi:hypothetical protein
MAEAKEKVNFEYRNLLAGQKTALANTVRFAERSFVSTTELNSFLDQIISLPKAANRAEVETLEPLKAKLNEEVSQLISRKERLISRHLLEIKELKRKFQQALKDS